MIRIYADFNSQDEQGRVMLNTAGSLEDLRNYEHDIGEGTEVILYMEDIELYGTLVFDGVWRARPAAPTSTPSSPDLLHRIVSAGTYSGGLPGDATQAQGRVAGEVIVTENRAMAETRVADPVPEFPRSPKFP